jgi:hypothetical protein
MNKITVIKRNGSKEPLTIDATDPSFSSPSPNKETTLIVPIVWPGNVISAPV